MKTIIKRVTPVMRINPVVYAMFFLLCLLGIISPSHAAGGKETVTYYHHDALGSVVAATDEQGEVIWREEYKPLGSRIVKESASTKNRIWYTGHAEEQALGLVYMGARWYHPEIGQFLSIDPVGFNEENPQSFNRYAYANQNPYKYVDPDGRDAVIAIDGSNINITLPIRYSGAGANKNTVEKFNAGIQKEWSGAFGRFIVKTTVTNKPVDGVVNDVSIPTGDYRATVTDGNRGNWPQDRPAWTAAHEAGHLLGLRDRYDPRSGRPDDGWEGNIMAQRNGKVDARNIIQVKNSDRNKIVKGK